MDIKIGSNLWRILILIFLLSTLIVWTGITGCSGSDSCSGCSCSGDEDGDGEDGDGEDGSKGGDGSQAENTCPTCLQ